MWMVYEAKGIDNVLAVVIIHTNQGGEVTNLHFNYKDVFRAGRLGFSAKKIWLAFLGFLVAHVGYCIFSYLAFVVGGLEIGEVWEVFRLTPMYPTGLPWFSWVIWIIAFLWYLCIALIIGVSISKVTYEQLKGDEFFEIKEAVSFALKNGKSAILAPIVLVAFMFALILMGVVLALITWVPYFGQLFFAVMSILAFAVCLFIIYLMIVTVVSLVIGPSIVGETGNDTFDTLFESFSVVNDQPWRFVIYEFLLVLVILIGVGLLGLFSAKAIFLGQDVIGLIVPAEKLDNLLINAAYYVKITVPPIMPESWHNTFAAYVESIGMTNLLYPPDYLPAYESWAGAITSFILGIVYYFIILFVKSLGAAILWAGNTVIFTVLVKKKDDKNLLEIKEEIFEEEKKEEVKKEAPKKPAPKKPRRTTRKTKKSR